MLGRRVLIGFLLLAAHIALPAQAEEAFSSAEVAVDATGKDAIDAKNKAIATGEVEAFRKLADKYAAPEAKPRAMTLEPAAVSAAVSGFEVMDEKITRNRYRANLKIHFNADQLKQHFGMAAGPAAAMPVGTASSGNAILVLPVLQQDASVLLWEPANNWRGIWNTTALEMGENAIIMPLGSEDKDNNGDVNIVNSGNVLAANFAQLHPLMTRYGAKELVVATAAYATLATPITIEVKLHRMAPGIDDSTSATYRVNKEETVELAMMRAVRDAINQFKGEAPITEAAATTNEGKVRILANIFEPSQWNVLKNKLQAFPSVKRVDLIAIMHNQLAAVLYYQGDVTLLQKGLIAQGVIVDDMGEYWALTIQ